MSEKDTTTEMLEDPDDWEQPCIRCGEVDTKRNMLALLPPKDYGWEDEEGDPWAEPGAWVHKKCWYAYRRIALELQLLDLERVLPPLAAAAKKQKKAG